jgi:hypothetical protein
MVAHTCNPSYSGGRDPEALQLEAKLGTNNSQLLSCKYQTQKRADGVAQAVGACLASVRS